MNIFVMTALMQLLPFFEKHLPGIKFLSRAELIIHFANMIFADPIEICFEETYRP
jgi:hypothetical protein